MPISQAERTFILNQLGQRAKEDMVRLWDAAQRFTDVDFFRFVTESFPDIAIGYNLIAAEFSAQWFEFDFPDLRAKTADPVDAKKLQKSAEWALGADGRQALNRLNGTMQRAIYDGDRNTTVQNASDNGMRWIRVARADACAFCRLLATRTTMETTYRSKEAALSVVGRSRNLEIGDRRKIQSGFWTREQALAFRDEVGQVYQRNSKYGKKGEVRTKRLRGTRKYGEKYHDDCHCTAKAIPAGINALDVLYEEEPDYAISVDVWNNEYFKAIDAATKNENGSSNVKQILAAWRQQGVR